MNPDATVEEYIEIIDELLSEAPVVRVKDIAKARGVSLPTASSAVEKLRVQGLVEHESYGYVTLTKEGADLAGMLSGRHNTIRILLNEIIGLNLVMADREACALEHHISPETVQAIQIFIEFIKTCPKIDCELIELFQRCGLRNDEDENHCSECYAERGLIRFS
ncbi:metal-dependent transcriptional regulator [bacterium]|nr:metal-dependent transcriptional regulator [bacterium]